MLEAGASVAPSRTLRTPGELLVPLVDGWRSLAAAQHVPYFATPDWVLAWWETFGEGKEAELAVWEGPHGEPEGVAGLIRTRERFHSRLPFSVSIWTNLGAGAGSADHCGWPVMPHRMQDVRSWIDTRTAGSPLLLRDLDPEAGTRFVPDGGQLLYRTRCPRLMIPDDGEALGRSGKSRKRIRSHTRKLLDQGVSFRWISPEEMDESTLQTLFRLHGERQAMLGRSSVFDPARRQLHRRLVARAGPGRGPTALVAEHEGRAVGIRYGFMWLDVFAGYQSGWDPAWAPYRLGTVLYSEAIQLSRAAGARVADFLRGTEEWKYRFGAIDHVDETWLIPRGLPARLLGLKYRLRNKGGGSRRMPPRVD